MKEAIGGAMTIQIIIVFLLIINAYLAFNVNYTKAFRVKNEIISIIEKNEGLTGADISSSSGAISGCQPGDNACSQIQTYLSQVGYNTNEFDCNRDRNDTGYTRMPGGYCVKAILEGTHNSSDLGSTYVGSHYAVKTFVKINFPVLDKFLPVLSNVFAVKGETKTIYSSGTDTEH